MIDRSILMDKGEFIIIIFKMPGKNHSMTKQKSAKSKVSKQRSVVTRIYGSHCNPDVSVVYTHKVTSPLQSYSQYW